jgi:hypothetical protein
MMQFQDDVAAGVTLVRPALQSPNYRAGSAGWAVKVDGSAEFNNVSIRGAATVGGNALYYNGTPAAGNLVLSVSGTAGTDAYGNTYVAGLGVYGTTDRITVRSSSGDTAVLRADAPSGIADTPSPGLVLSKATGDAAAASLTEFDDTFSRGIYLRAPSPVADPNASEGSDYASIRMFGRFHGQDPAIDMEANGPNSTITFNGTMIGPDGGVQIYGGGWQTYTPSMTNTGGATWSTRTGYWRRLGDWIDMRAYFVFSGAGSSTTAVSVTAPTLIDRTTRQFVTAHLEQVATGSAGTGTALAFAGGSGNVFDRIRNPSNSSMNGVDFTASSIVTLQGWYREG